MCTKKRPAAMPVMIAMLSVLLAVTCLASCELFFGTAKGTVSATVKWPGTGAGMNTGLPYVPATKATAILSGTDGTELRRVGCDNEGVFVAGNLEPGDYTLRVELEDCMPLTMTVRVEAGKEIRLRSEPLNCLLLAPEPVKKPWTILYYMNGTDPAHVKGNLSTLRLFEKVIDSDTVNILSCLYDGANAATRLYFLKKPDYTVDPDPIDDLIENARVLSPFHDLNEDVTESEPGLPATLETFIKYGKEHYPADHYLVVVSGHGTGIDMAYPRSGDEKRSRSISPNISTHKEILVPEFASAIAGANTDRTVSIVAAEACYMGMAEVAIELQDTGIDYYIASECTVGNRVIVPATIQALCEGSISTPGDLARHIVGQYGGNTLAAVRIARIPAFLEIYDRFARSLDSHGVNSVLRSIAAATFNASMHGGTESDLYSSYYDLGHFSRLVATSESITDVALKTAAAELHTEFTPSETSILAAFRRNGDGSEAAQGLSTLLYLPDRKPARYAEYARPIYRSLRVYRDGLVAWDSILEKFSP